MSIVITDEQAKRNIAANIRYELSLRDPPQNQQKWLAKATGESEMRISLYINEQVMCGAAVLKRIAEALGRTADEMMDKLPKQPRGKKSA
jgi:hypothetical protein